MKKTILILLFVVSLIYCDDLLAATIEVGAGQTYTTITSAVTAATSGDTINVHSGTYTETVTITKPLIVQRNLTDSPLISGNVVITTGINEVTVDGFTITGGSGAGIYSRNSNRITIKNNTIYGMLTGSIDGDGIQINSGHSSDGTYANGIIIDSNTIHDNDIDGLKVHGQYFTVSNNYVYSNINTNWAAIHPDGIQLNAGTADGYTSVQYAKIFNNIFKNHIQNIFSEGSVSGASSDCIDIHIYNNVLYQDNGMVNGVDMDTLTAANINIKYSKDVFVYNNTLGRTKGTSIRVQQNAPGTVHIKNNIISNSNSTSDYAINMDVVGDIADGELDYNLYNMSAAKIVYWGGTYYTTLAAFKMAQPTHEVHGLEADPKINLFPTPTLQSGSPAINAGANLGTSYNVDKSGIARPSAAPWDIGAYQLIRPSPPVLNSIQ